MSLVEIPRYGIRNRGGHHGTVATKPIVAKVMLDLVGYVSNRDLSQVRLLDPAGGNGVFVLEALKRLSASAHCYGFSFAQAYSNLSVVEIDPDSAVTLRNNIVACLDTLGRSEEVKNPDLILTNGDFLLSPIVTFDVVVGNPPYVRHDNIPTEAREQYRQRYRAFSHRADLYVSFFEKGLRSLTPGGKLCYLCANRWLKNSYGQGLRGLIARGYTLSIIIDLENANPFEEDVSAYPAITVIENRLSDDPIRWSTLKTVDELSVLNQSFSLLPRPQSSDWQQNFRGEARSRTMQPIEMQGFKINIGVATGADRVFIGTNIDVEESRLIPMLMTRDLRDNQLVWSGKHLVNPFEIDGRLVDLADYPRLAKYLSGHEHTLRKRYIAQKNPLSWYRTIDRIHAELTTQPKLLLPDMSANYRLLIDEGTFYPHHNLYYITGADLKSLKVLGALLMTTPVRDQLARLSTRMNGGYVRWQSQHLRKLVLPVIDNLSPLQKEELVEVFDSGSKDI